MDKQELFFKAIAAYDNYTRAVKLKEPEYQNYYSMIAKTLLNQIKANGWLEDFEQFTIGA